MLGLAIAALVAAPPGAAHVTLAPAAVESGQATTLEVEVPALPSGEAAVGVELAGAGLEQLGVEAPREAGAERRFEVRVRVDAPPGPLVVELRIVYPGGESVLAPQTLTVTPPAPAETRRWPLLAAAAAGALALAALGLRRRHRRG